MTEPYYQDDAVTLWHGDCLSDEIAPHWLAADVLVTDPPYGMAYVSHASSYKAGIVRPPTAPIAGDENAQLRDDILAAWGDRPALVFGTWRVPRPPAARALVVWDKGDSPGTGALDIPWGPSHEEVYVLGRGFVGKRRGGVLRVTALSSQDRRREGHPTPKPQALMEMLIDACPPGVIADPCAGSGPTLVAAKALGRRAVGVEVEERYCEVIAKRLAQDVLDFASLA